MGIEKSYKEELINQIKDCGQELIDKAETLVPDDDYITNFSIDINFEKHACPEIHVNVSMLSEKTLRRKCYI